MNQATPAWSLLLNSRGSIQTNYAVVAVTVGALALAGMAMLGQSFSAAVNDPVNSTPPELDSYAFISTHDPLYNVGSVALGSEDSLDEPQGADDGSADAQQTPLDQYNECLAQGNPPEVCAAEHLGEDDVTTSDEVLTNDGPSSGGPSSEGPSSDDIGSNSQGGFGSPYGEAPSPNDGSGGFGNFFDGGFGDVFGGLGRVAGNVASTVGRGFMGVLAGTGGAVMGSVAGLFNGEGFFGGMKSGWSDGWNACQDGPVLSMGCAGRAAVGVASVAVVAAGAVAAGSVFGVTAAGAAAFAGKSLAAGAVYTFFLEPDTLSGAWHDIKSGDFSLPRTTAAVAENFRGCVESPGGCIASIATGAAVYGAFRGVSAVWRGFIARPIAHHVMQTGIPAQGIMRLGFMQNLAPRLSGMPWLLKVPGFRIAAREAAGGRHLAYSLRAAEKLGVQPVAGGGANTARYMVQEGSKQADWLVASHVNQANRNALGFLGNARQNLSRSIVADRTARPVIAAFDPKSRLLTHMLPGVAARSTTWYGRMLDTTLIGIPTFAGTHAVVGATANGIAANSAASNRLASWFDDQGSGVEHAPGFNAVDLYSQP